MRRKYRQIWILMLTYQSEHKSENVFDAAYVNMELAYAEMLKTAKILSPNFVVKGSEIEIPATEGNPPRVLWLRRHAMRVK